MRDNDTVEEVVHVMDHDTVLFFSPDGICRSLKAYQIPVSSKTAMGAPLTQVCTPFIDPAPALDPGIGRHRAWSFDSKDPWEVPTTQLCQCGLGTGIIVVLPVEVTDEKGESRRHALLACLALREDRH